MIGEYGVYVVADPELLLAGGEKWVLVLLKLLGKGSGWSRVGFIVLYTLWAFTNHSTPDNGKRPKPGILLKLLIIGCYVICSWLLIRILDVPFLNFLYPLSFAGVLLSGMFLPLAIRWKKVQPFGIRNETRKLENAYSFNFRTRDGYINVVNPFRGIFISGAAGAGKSESLAYPSSSRP